MAKYKVWGSFTAHISIEVEADNEEEAFDAAYCQFGGIASFVGNGGTDKLIGVTGSNETIEAEEPEIEWNEAKELK